MQEQDKGLFLSRWRRPRSSPRTGDWQAQGGGEWDTGPFPSRGRWPQSGPRTGDWCQYFIQRSAHGSPLWPHLEVQLPWLQSPLFHFLCKIFLLRDIFVGGGGEGCWLRNARSSTSLCAPGAGTTPPAHYTEEETNTENLGANYLPKVTQPSCG